MRTSSPRARTACLPVALLFAAGLPPTAALHAQAATAAPPAAAGAPLVIADDSTLFPEGLVRDAARGRWLVSSIRHRTIVAVDDAGRVTPFARDLPRDVGAVFGMRVDAARGLLVAASGGLPQMRDFTADDTLRAELLELDLASGALRRRVPLPEAGRHRLPGDLVIGRDGTWYVTDGLAARLYVLPVDGPPRTIVSPRFRSLQGLVLAEDERTLIVADYANGLLRVPLAGDDTVTAITDTAGRRLQGIDGLYRHGDALVATWNARRPGRVLRVTLSSDGRAIADVAVLETVPGDGEPTLGVILDGALVFIANSPWSAYDDAGARRPGSVLARPELRRLPLPR